MSFKIEITEKRRITLKKQEWVKTSDTGNAKDGGAVYEYGPAVERPDVRDYEVLTQEVDELDVAAVIKAINKL